MILRMKNPQVSTPKATERPPCLKFTPGHLSIVQVTAPVGLYLYDSIGRGGEIRTHDPLRPRHVRYQAALRPDILHI